MMLKFGRIALVSTTVLTLAAAAIPSRAEAFLYYPGGYGPVAYGGGYYGAGCGCQVYVPPPPPPPCCRVYGPQPYGVYGGGYYGGGYGGGYGVYNGGGYGPYNGGGYGGYEGY